MTKRFKIFVCILLSLSFAFISVGYAAISDNLSIIGNVRVEYEFIGIYISGIDLVSSSSGVEINDYHSVHPTSISTNVNSQSGGSVTYKVTVCNNSDVTYWYLGQKYMTNGANALLGASSGITVVTKNDRNDSTSTFNNNDWVPAMTERVFYVTYTYGPDARGDLTNLINFEFGIKIDAISDHFLRVLNDKTSEYGYYYLSNAFDEKYAEDGSTVIGNVGDEQIIFDNLFGRNLKVNLDGTEKSVTVMVCRENVDRKTTGDAYKPSGPSGCDYTVYVTVEDLDPPSGKAEVFAVSYMLGSNGKWKQVGQLYTGEANMVDYDKSTSDYEPAFDVHNWKATPKEYKVADGIVYYAGYEQGDQYQKYKTIEEIISADDQNFYNTIDNSRFLKKVFDILVANPSDSVPGIANLRVAFENASHFIDIRNDGQEIKVKRNYTRAEIISFLEAMQMALDYYYDVN